jgi:hypothetical protein
MSSRDCWQAPSPELPGGLEDYIAALGAGAGRPAAERATGSEIGGWPGPWTWRTTTTRRAPWSWAAWVRFAVRWRRSWRRRSPPQMARRPGGATSSCPGTVQHRDGTVHRP